MMKKTLIHLLDFPTFVDFSYSLVCTLFLIFDDIVMGSSNTTLPREVLREYADLTHFDAWQIDG